MKITRLDLPVMSSWIEKNSLRLDPAPYLSGSFEAKVILSRLTAKKEPLQSVTKDLLNPGRFSRLWVNDPAHGVPFLSSVDILQADLSSLSLISKKAIKANPKLLIEKDWILITRSGTIGRMAYVRADMSGMACTEDVLRVVPDPEKILPGYLYAYLSSKFGIPQIVSGTYGAIIQHIEPSHIKDLPVPRLGEAIEAEVHELIQSSANKRVASFQKKYLAIDKLYSYLNLTKESLERRPESFATFSAIPDNSLRLDAFHYSPNSTNALSELELNSDNFYEIDKVAKVFSTNIFKRIYTDTPSCGYPYFSGSELFQIYPEKRGYLAKGAPNIRDYLIEKDWLLIQDAGQVGGLIGQVVRVPAYAHQSVVSNHLMRIVPNSREDSAYLFAVLASPHGYRAIVRNAFGTSIPQLDSSHISKIKVPWPGSDERFKIAEDVLEAWDLFDQANDEEQSAIQLVEKAIEEGANG